MSRPIGDVGDEILVTGRLRAQLVHDRADGLHHLEIGALIVPAHIVCLADRALLVDEAEGLDVIVDVKPVTNVRALAVDGERLPVKAIEDDERNQFLGEVVRPVVVRAVGDLDGQAVGVVPGAHDMVGRCLRGRVRRVRGVGRRLGEEPGLAQGAVYFVRRDVLEGEVGMLPPVLERDLEERRGADDVGADELARPVDRPVDVGFRREMEDRVRLKGRERLLHCLGIADVGDEEAEGPRGREVEGVASGQVIGIEADLLERFGYASVGELVDDKDTCSTIPDEVANERRAYEPAPTSYDATSGTSLHLQNPPAWLRASWAVSFARPPLRSAGRNRRMAATKRWTSRPCRPLPPFRPSRPCHP